jgi:CMP-2-keto-3-deoxyoctulosonic acid synthetase
MGESMMTSTDCRNFSALTIGCRMNVLQVDDVGIGVDTPEDILKVEAILASKNIKL